MQLFQHGSNLDNKYKGEGEYAEDSADIGGMLLSPVFYLVNFVADAITANLGRIMLGQSIDLTSGIGILVTKENYKRIYGDTEIDNTDTYKVDIKSFAFEAYQYPNIQYTPEEIFSGQIDLLSIDFISGKSAVRDEYGNIKRDEDGNIEYTDNANSGWQSIRKVISEWYKVIRMIAIIGLLSVLIYTGIKIIISANAKDKAKYKEWVMNWFMAVAILFFMHYIMAFIISVTGELSNLLSNATRGINVELVNGGQPVTDSNGEQVSFVTNLMGLVRFMVQSENFYIKVGYEIMYIALIFYTIKFTMVYLKRVLNMAFLTLIAPIVALTYPIDKINDGKAQGFDMWLKEYIFNALLQPMHFVMYYILVGAAVGIAASNPIYGIVVLAFMTEAEKLLKKIFGFDKAGAGTVGGMTGAFAAGALASNVKNIAKMVGGKGGNGGNGGPDGGNGDNQLNKPKPTDVDDEKDDALFDDPAREDSNPAGGERDNPAGGDDNPVGGDDNPVGGDDNPVGGDDNPVGGDDNPVGGDDNPVGGDDNPVGGDDNPAGGDDNPAGGGDNPAEEGGDNPAEEGGDDSDEEGGDDPEEENPAPENKTPVRKMAEKITNSRQYKGAANVVKTLVKPAWDLDQGWKYNGKRLLRKVGKAAVGFSVGTAAAAVQAGISITDGKYNPMEGIATFGAGYAGGTQIAKNMGGLLETYREGRDEGNKTAIMKRAKEKWPEREDVVKYNKKYKEKERPNVLEIQKQLLEQGITDPKEMDRCIKYMKASNNDVIPDASDKNLIRKSRVLHDFDAELASRGMQSAPYDKDKEEKYIATMTQNLTGAEKDKAEAQYRNKFRELRKYHDAQK